MTVANIIAGLLIVLHIVLILRYIRPVLADVNPRYRMEFAIYLLLHLGSLAIAVVALLT